MKTSKVSRRIAYWSALTLALSATSCVHDQARWTPPELATQSAVTDVAPIVATKPREVEAANVENDGAKHFPLEHKVALISALTNNLGIAMSRIDTDIDKTYRPEALAEFDPTFSASVTYNDSTRQQSAVATETTGTSNTQTSTGTTDGDTTTYQQLQQVISGVQELRALLQEPTIASQSSRTTNASASLQQRFPQGTLVTLSASASGVDSSSVSYDDIQTSWQLEVRQPLLKDAGSAVNLVAVRQADNRIARGVYGLKADMIALAEQVDSAYWELVLARETKSIRDFAVALADEQLQQNQGLLSVGRATRADVLSAEAEHATRIADLSEAEAEIRSQQYDLLRLLNPTPHAGWDVRIDTLDEPIVPEVPSGVDAIEANALRYRPEIAQAKLDAADSDLNVVSARNDLRPQLDVVASYEATGRSTSFNGSTSYLDSGDYDGFSVGVEFYTPLLRRAEKARLQRAKYQVRKAELSIDDWEQAVSVDVRQALVELQKQVERHSANLKAVESKQAEMEITKGRYTMGKETNLELLIVQRDLIQAKLDEVTARIRAAQAVTRLYAAEGTLLERFGIAVPEMEDANG